jgi:NADPH:quinone reductase-like Zn-dependent oxidoreductase
MFIAAAASCPAADRPSMQAAVVRASAVHVQTLPRPVAAAGQVLVKLRFAGVSPADWKDASGHAEDPGIASAANAAGIPGLDGSGVIAAVGAGVTGYRPGDAVMVWSRAHGTYAQYVAVPVATIAHKPDSMSFEQAAGVAHAGLAAWNMLIDIAHVKAGQQVLVLGGAGAVGSAAVQIAKNNGARVIATTSTRNLEYLRSLGADQVIDYTRAHFEDQVRNADIVINTVDADNAFRGLAVLRQGGFLVSSNGLPAADQCAGRGVVCSMRTATGTPTAVVLRQLAEWSQAGQYQVNIDQIYALSEVLKAWGYSQAGHTRGKSLIRIGE